MNDICKDLIQDFLLHLGKERNLSQNTISAYGRDLKRFFTFLVDYDSTLVNNLIESIVMSYVISLVASLKEKISGQEEMEKILQQEQLRESLQL